jgi:hypothetical protein
MVANPGKAVAVGCFFAAGLLCSPIVAVPAGAAEQETRDYTVYVDGKPAGTAHITIQTGEDGVTTVTADTDVRVRVLFFKYSYWYRGKETWKDGRLVRLESSSDDDGKRYTVSAAADNDRLRVTVNGETRHMRGDVWPTSFWQVPAGGNLPGAVTLLDVDTGRELHARVQKLGAQQVAVEGRAQNASHYRLLGKITVDLWFDGNSRMVRQDFVDEGHRTIIELAGVRR